MTYSKVIRDKVLASERAAHRAPATKAARDAFKPFDLKALTKEEAQAESQRLYGEHSDYARRRFDSDTEELLDLGWPTPHIAAELLYVAGVEELSPEFISEVEEELARIADLEEEDENEQEENLVRLLMPALAKLKAETKAGTLSDEKRAAIFTIFGESFMKPGVAGTESTAQRLHAYMTFRAEREGQVHDLTTDYYQAALDKGIKGFFGVAVGPDGLEYDTQQPQLFTEWKRAQKKEEL